MFMPAGFCTLLHVVQFRIPFTKYYYGSGIVSVCGTSFTTLSIGFTIVGNLLVGSPPPVPRGKAPGERLTLMPFESNVNVRGRGVRTGVYKGV